MNAVDNQNWEGTFRAPNKFGIITDEVCETSKATYGHVKQEEMLIIRQDLPQVFTSTVPHFWTMLKKHRNCS